MAERVFLMLGGYLACPAREVELGCGEVLFVGFGLFHGFSPLSAHVLPM